MLQNNCDLVELTMKNTAILLLSASILGLSGCTNSFSKVSTAMKDAPDWYEQRRKEVRGEGYPELSEVPVIDQQSKPGASLPARTLAAEGLLAEFDRTDAALRSSDSIASIEAALAAAQDNFATANTSAAPQMSATRAAEIVEAFNVPRVTEGLKSPQ